MVTIKSHSVIVVVILMFIGQFVEAVPSNGETKNLDFDCENCFKLVNNATMRCMIVTLDNSIPRLQTKLKVIKTIIIDS